MPRLAYINGRYDSIGEAVVNIEDRGYQFADGVYEAMVVVDGAYWDEEGHLNRLERSLRELQIAPPMSRRALKNVISSVVRMNRLRNAFVYIQVTRGVAPRNHAFPAKAVVPSLIVTAKPYNPQSIAAQAEKGVAVITAPDQRWGRVDIKTVNLLPNALAKEAARRAGAVEAWLVRNNKVTEGSSSNAWIVTDKGEIVTHPLGNEILGGITRQTVIACAEELQMKVVERPFTVDEAKRAAEAFLTSASLILTPVISIDGKPVGKGTPGPVAKRLREAYVRRCTAAVEAAKAVA